MKASLRAGINLILELELTQVIPHIPDFEANFFPHVPIPRNRIKRRDEKGPSTEMILGMLLEKWMAKPQVAMAHSERALQIAESRISWKFRFPESCSPPASSNQFHPTLVGFGFFFPKALISDIGAMQKDFIIRLLQATSAEKRGQIITKVCVKMLRGTQLQGNEDAKAAQWLKIAGLELWMALKRRKNKRWGIKSWRAFRIPLTYLPQRLRKCKREFWESWQPFHYRPLRGETPGKVFKICLPKLQATLIYSPGILSCSPPYHSAVISISTPGLCESAWNSKKRAWNGNSLLDDFVAFGLGEGLQLEGLVSEEGHGQMEIIIPELGEREEIKMGG